MGALLTEKRLAAVAPMRRFDQAASAARERSTPGFQSLNQGCNRFHIRVMTGSHGERRPADADWTNQGDEPSLSNPITNLGNIRPAIRYLGVGIAERIFAGSSERDVTKRRGMQVLFLSNLEHAQIWMIAHLVETA